MFLLAVSSFWLSNSLYFSPKNSIASLKLTALNISLSMQYLRDSSMSFFSTFLQVLHIKLYWSLMYLGFSILILSRKILASLVLFSTFKAFSYSLSIFKVLSLSGWLICINFPFSVHSLCSAKILPVSLSII